MNDTMKRNDSAGIRIGMISDHGDPFARIGGEEAGGQNMYVKYLGQKLVERGYHIDVFTRWQSRKMSEVSVKKGLRIIRIKAGPVGFLSKDDFRKVLPEFIDGIRRYVEKNGRYDIIHSHYWLSGLAAIELKKQLGMPFVHTFHSLGAVKHRTMDINTEGSRFRDEKEKEIIKNADLVVSTSPQERDDIQSLSVPDAENIVIVPVGVDLKHFCFYSKTLARRQLGNGAKHIMLFVGRFEERKGLAQVIRAVGMLKDTLPDAHKDFRLWVIGGDVKRKGTGIETEEVNRIRELVDEAGASENIRFIGRVPNSKLKMYYAAADVTVVPSYYEPFGIVPLESMACGTPAIVSKVGGLQFTVEDGVTGFHVPPRSHKDIADKTAKIFLDEYLRLKLSSNSVENIHKHFSWDDVTTLLTNVYLHVALGSELRLNENKEVKFS